MDPEALSAAFYRRPAEVVARDLLGCLLVSDTPPARTAGRIVETEAYTGPDDPACHAAASVGRTDRNDPLFGPPGTAYMHLNYGIHWCFNAVTGEEGHPAGVLVRALEPLEGRELMRERRGHEQLTSGPGRLTQALGLGPDLQRHRLDRPPLRVLPAEPPVPRDAVAATPRIGISRATERELRFVDTRSSWLSR